MLPHLRSLTKKEQKQNNQMKKWAKFMYAGKETRFIKKLFDTNVKIAFTTDNTTEKCLALKQEAPKTNMAGAMYTI